MIRSILMLTVIFLYSCQESTDKKSRVDALPYYSEATFTPHWFAYNDDSLLTFHRISPFILINQEGDTVTEKTFENKIYITDFFFTTCPGICPEMTANMDILQKEFFNDDDILLLSHTVTPNADSVPVLKDYATEKGVRSGKWHLVTGDREQIYKLGRQDYFVEEDLGIEKEEEDFIHTENFVLVDKRRYIRGIYNGLNKTSINQLIADIKTLKNEKPL